MYKDYCRTNLTEHVLKIVIANIWELIATFPCGNVSHQLQLLKCHTAHPVSFMYGLQIFMLHYRNKARHVPYQWCIPKIQNILRQVKS